MAHRDTLDPTPAGARSDTAHSTTTRPAACVPASDARPSGGDAQLASRVMERHAQLGRLNHFELLGLAETASSEAIRAAYERNARSFHPDLLRGAYEHLRPLAKEIYCRVQAAYAVLQNEQSRLQYLVEQARRPAPSLRPGLPGLPGLPSTRPSNPALRATPSGFRPGLPSTHPTLPELPASLQPGRPTSLPPGAPRRRSSLPALRPSMQIPQAELPSGWDAAKAFAAARIHTRRGALETALAFAQQACDTDPGNLEYQALFAWLYAQGIELEPGREADELLAILTRAVRADRENLELRMYRGRLLQRLGRADEAVRDFSVVASMDPNHVDAAREVRLHRMRSEQRSPSGVFSKLFMR